MRRPLAGLLAAIAVALGGAAPVPDAARYGPPQPVTLVGYDGHAMEPFLSRDGRTLFFNNRNDPADQTDLHWAQRIDDLTFRYRGRVEGANSADLDGVATLSRDGRFCFVSPRAYAQTLATIHCGVWRDGRVADVALQTGVSVRTPGWVVFDVEISADGDELVVADGDLSRGPVPRTADLRRARPVAGEFRLEPADDRLFAAVNSKALEYAAALSADSRLLAFTRMEGRPPFVRLSIWIARRDGPERPFGRPVRIEAIKGFVEGPTFSPDDRALYYHRREGGRFVIMRVARQRP